MVTGWRADGALGVRVTAPPVAGAANGALCEILADTLGVPRAAVTLVRGARGRDKLIRVAGLTPGDVHDRIARRE
jgi:uncharacterized protein YggU (UPF0235/DUF167 family)